MDSHVEEEGRFRCPSESFAAADRKPWGRGRDDGGVGDEFAEELIEVEEEELRTEEENEEERIDEREPAEMIEDLDDFEDLDDLSALCFWLVELATE